MSVDMSGERRKKMKPRNILDNLMQDINGILDKAETTLKVVEDGLGKCTAREDYERTEIESMREEQ